jgi:hypothetical protein
LQDPVNVVRAMNYYHSPGWGAPMTADAGYRGKLSNINLGGDWAFPISPWTRVAAPNFGVECAGPTAAEWP